MESAQSLSATGKDTRTEEIMRPALTTVEREAHLAAAAYLMHKQENSALVVVSDGADPRPLGVVTDTDIAKAVAAGQDVNEQRIKDLPVRPPVVVPPQASVQTSVQKMMTAGVNQLPVVADGEVLGMVYIRDACRVLLDALD